LPTFLPAGSPNGKAWTVHGIGLSNQNQRIRMRAVRR
jgi:hypothetical protein